MNINSVFKFFLLTLVLLPNLSKATESAERISHCRYLSNDVCYLASEFLDVSTKSVINLSADVVNQPEYLKTLQSYYSAAKNNDLQKIISLYSDVDGSKKIVEENLRKNPTAYARFHQVGDINVHRVLRSGNYYMIIVSWHDKQGGFLADWTELLHCDGHCKMSDRILKPTDETSFFALSLGGQPLVSSVKNSSQLRIISVTNDSGDAEISLAIKPVSTMTQTEIQTSSAVADLIQTLRANGQAVNQNFSSDFNRLKDETLGLFEGYWPGINERVVYYYPNDAGSSVRFSMLGLYVLANRLSSISSLKPAFMMQGENVDFYFMLAQREDREELLQFYIDRKGNILSQVELKGADSGIAQILQHRYVYDKLLEFQFSKGVELLSSDFSSYKKQFVVLGEGVEELEVKAAKKPEGMGLSAKFLVLLIVVTFLCGMFIFYRKKK